MKNDKSILDFWKQFKKIGNDKLILILIAGVLLLLSGGNSNKNVNGKEEYPKLCEVTKNYEAELEERLKSIFESAYGIGKIEVMITLEETEEKILATLKEECIFDGDSPYVVKNESPKIRGVVVVVGETKMDASLEIAKACEVLLGISSNRIRIIHKK